MIVKIVYHDEEAAKADKREWMHETSYDECDSAFIKTKVEESKVYVVIVMANIHGENGQKRIREVFLPNCDVFLMEKGKTIDHFSFDGKQYINK
jgi:hypothetical protein